MEEEGRDHFSWMKERREGLDALKTKGTAGGGIRDSNKEKID